ncbi:hypothetical protein P154DRAFT_568919 [Amniculicola lignicola CBS 123094]|uniref:MARVEL domain-containing protein n=1 Tax=Amniculicola lignicola CBS 123094 TaxID=1392246 RepID=A0A6A5X587_9PLEO|nr:hypothetical protein P154DRAFT_568919 [Amniculicola lignicola CBS 123094]
METAPNALAEQPPPQTLRAKLDAGEQHWVWKYSLRTLLIVIGIIGVGCVAWIISSSSKGPYGFRDWYYVMWSLITFSASVIWCAICIFVFLLRREHTGVHPGAAVGIDLVLWLAYIPTAMMMLIGAVNVMEWGRGGRIGQYSSYGYFYQQDNGTWAWNMTEYDAYVGRQRDCSIGGRYNIWEGYGFDSCAEEDAYINTLWKAKDRRVGVEMTASVCQFLGLLLHLTLFIWACVDTHRRNRRKTSKEAEKLAANIVMNMVRNGAIVTNTPASQQSGPYQQLRDPPPGGVMAPVQQGHMMPSGWNAVPQAMMSREKVDESARFA